jgi:hypothetical protein
VVHGAGELGAKFEGSPLRFLANSAWVTCSAQKTAESLFEWILAHLARQKGGPSLGVGMKPTAANQLKRGGFLKVRPKQSHCRVGLNLQSAPICKFGSPHSRAALLQHHATHGCIQSPIDTCESALLHSSRTDMLPNRRRCFDRLAFKKTCPCVPSRAGVARHGRQRTDPTRSLGGSFSGVARLSKGSTGFLARDRNPSQVG